MHAIRSVHHDRDVCLYVYLVHHSSGQLVMQLSAIPSVSQSDVVLQQGAAGWNNMLFVQATLADLDRLDPERLFCLTQIIDKCV